MDSFSELVIQQTDDHMSDIDNIAYRDGSHFFCMK